MVRAGAAQGLRIEMGPDTDRFLAGDYERPVQEALERIVRSGDVCYDIGANLGFFSLFLGRSVAGGGLVYAFEPVPRNASMIERNADLNGIENIRVMRMALSGEDGKGNLLLARHVGGAMLREAGTPPDLAGSMVVATARVDTLVDRQEIRPPNVVKIDVEGAEMAVLLGMERTLQRWAPRVVMEFDDPTEDGCESKLSGCRRFLQDLGYRVRVLPNSYADGSWFVRHFAAEQR